MLRTLAMPSLLAEDPERRDFINTSPSYGYFPRTSSDKQHPIKNYQTSPLSNGSPVKPNGILSNGTSPSLRPLPNGKAMPPSMVGKERSRQSDASTSTTNGYVLGGENEKASLDGAAEPDGRSSRDDGFFASVESSKTKDCMGTTHVKLEPTTTGGAYGPTVLDLQPDAVPYSPELGPPQKESAPSQQTSTAPDGGLRIPKTANRSSSPATLQSPLTPITTTQSRPDRLQHRHTLEVPRVSTARLSRDLPSGSTSANASEDVLSATGRFSPNTPTRRRNSMQLVRRTTRSIHSDMHLDEVPQDEDAARWAEHIRQKRMSKRKKKDDEDDDRVVVGTKVDQNHVNWVTAYNMLTGIRFTVSRTNAKLDRELTDADFDAKHKFSFDITGNELTPSAKYDFKFKDYAPWVFRHLRATFKLDPADYLMSLTSKYILSELGSPGKSGSFFYFSRDYKYIIKTIHHAEHKFLRKILKEYYNHVHDNPNTLLSQFYGLHRVKIPYGRKIHFVVMNNLFPPHRDIHRTFDLKGSTIGRDFREEDLEKNPRATLKDLNWLRRNLHLEFGPTKKHIFIEQMEKDVKLLQRLKIMDYSMLIGIHDLERGNEENLRDKTLKVFEPGGDHAEDPS
ncbi:hypothetical protein LTS18_010685, partial [Coniosporium uncinatum]